MSLVWFALCEIALGYQPVGGHGLTGARACRVVVQDDGA